ncbi:MAG: hypothetical protein JO148_05505 [Acidimicrobiia bacterium]|nr:hypothetical protein [Acidimicrobiia bacterium]
MTPGRIDNDAVWPAVPVDAWADTRTTVHMWTQIVGKIRMANTPVVNHWWNVTLYVTTDGLTTSPIPRGDRTFQIDFDFQDHRLQIETSDGEQRSMKLEPRTVADFYEEIMTHLDELGLSTSIWTTPVEVPGLDTPFDEDVDHDSYDAEAMHRYWRSLVQTDRVFRDFRTRFVGKVSPVHFFWGGFDLAVTRFSGRAAPLHPGGAPHCGPEVMHEAYSHEVSSAGYWQGGGPEGSYYSYAYLEPPGYRDQPVGPSGAGWSDDLGEFILPYDLVRTADDPDATLLEFLQTTYEAAANTADWDRAALEAGPGPLPGLTAAERSMRR